MLIEIGNILIFIHFTVLVHPSQFEIFYNTPIFITHLLLIWRESCYEPIPKKLDTLMSAIHTTTHNVIFYNLGT